LGWLDEFTTAFRGFFFELDRLEKLIGPRNGILSISAFLYSCLLPLNLCIVFLNSLLDFLAGREDFPIAIDLEVREARCPIFTAPLNRRN
jgi:hypothetical protein